MPRNIYEEERSDLEREFDLEMEDDELENYELEDEEEDDFDEETFDSEEETGLEDVEEEFAERLQEIFESQFESRADLDAELESVLGSMKDRFWGLAASLAAPLLKKAAGKVIGAGGKYLKKRLAGRRPRRGRRISSRGIQAPNMLQGLLKSLLGGGGQKGLGSLLRALGVRETELSDDRDMWRIVVDKSKDAYEYLAENMTEDALDDVGEAAQLASEAFESAFGRKKTRVLARRGRGARKKRIVIRPGDSVELVGMR